MEELAKTEHEVVSFDKINPSLLFFHEGENQSFSIITNKSENDKEYQRLLNFKNCMANEQDKVRNLPKYNLYKTNEFLKELKDILNVKNKVTEAEIIGDEFEEEEEEDEEIRKNCR